MVESKEQIVKAIIIIGESLGMKKNTEELLLNTGIYSTIQPLIYKMFVEDKQQYFEKDDEVFDAIILVRKYCKEMSVNGEVNFNIPYVYNKPKK